MSITDVPGVEVGHRTDPVGRTGCTVIVFPEPNVAAVEIRGAAPGSRETALLAPGMKVETIQALLFTGGSAFGLAAADGVVRRLYADGRGHPALVGPVPIVPAAVIYDLHVGEPGVVPGPDDGAAAYDTRDRGPVVEGCVGAGTGATVAGWRGPDAVRPGGIGSASMTVAGAEGPVVVGALAVVNAVGDVFTLEGEPLTDGPPLPGPPPVRPPVERNTTLVCVATDARLDRSALTRLCVRSQDALAVCLRPAHTRYDGDASFAVSCGGASADVDTLAEAAFVATGRAIERAIRAADPGRSPARPDAPEHDR